MKIKDCFPYWLNCPNIQGLTICTKVRVCDDERKCFTEWRKQGGIKATKDMIENWS